MGTNQMGEFLTEAQKLPSFLCSAVVDKIRTLDVVLGVAELLQENEWVLFGEVKPVTGVALLHAAEVKPDLQPVLELKSKSQPDVLGKKRRVQTAHSTGLQLLPALLYQPQQPLGDVQPMACIQHILPASNQQGRFPTLPNTVPCMSGVERLAPEIVFGLLKSHQCVLVDTRGDDRGSGCIEGAVHEPAINVLSTNRVPEMMEKFGGTTIVVFHCQYSCHRAPTCANMFRKYANPSQQVAVLDGGFRGWESAGLPILVGSVARSSGFLHCTSTHSRQLD